MENFERDGNTRPLYQSPEKLVCRSRGNRDTDNGLVQNWKRSMTRLYCVILFNLYAEQIMWNARLEKSQAGIKTAGRNTNNLRYGNDTTLMTESEKDLKSLLMRVKEESEKLAWNSTLKKLRLSHPVPLLHGKQKRKKWKQRQILLSWAQESLPTVTAAMKLKGVCPPEAKLWQT